MKNLISEVYEQQLSYEESLKVFKVNEIERDRYKANIENAQQTVIRIQEEDFKSLESERIKHRFWEGHAMYSIEHILLFIQNFNQVADMKYTMTPTMKHSVKVKFTDCTTTTFTAHSFKELYAAATHHFNHSWPGTHQEHPSKAPSRSLLFAQKLGKCSGRHLESPTVNFPPLDTSEPYRPCFVSL